MIIDAFIQRAKADGASDVHMVCGIPPRYRVDGALRDMSTNILAPEHCQAIAEELAGDRARDPEVREIDMALTIAGTRCRINLFRQQKSWSAAIRLLSDRIPEMSELGLPPVAAELPHYAQGLILITGETGSGKSTTLASVLNTINLTSDQHILTLEDPIEYVYTPARCVINQREIGRDTASFADGLRAALREDPDVILVGEMRDLETIETALTAAETGHLVFGTVHTNSAADSIDRIVDVFPANRQQQIRLQLSMTLKAVLSQQLLPRVGGGRVLACEVMKVDGAIRNLIREGKTPQIVNSIQTSGAVGNILMERALQNLFAEGKIAENTMRAALGEPVEGGAGAQAHTMAQGAQGYAQVTQGYAQAYAQNAGVAAAQAAGVAQTAGAAQAAGAPQTNAATQAVDAYSAQQAADAYAAQVAAAQREETHAAAELGYDPMALAAAGVSQPLPSRAAAQQAAQENPTAGTVFDDAYGA